MDIFKTIFFDIHFSGTLLAVIIIIFLGFILRYINVFTDQSKKTIVTILMKLSLPCMAINAFMIDYDGKAVIENIKLFFLSLLIYLIILISTRLLFFKKSKEEKDIFSLFTALGQVTLISLPLLKSIFSENLSEIMIPGNMLTLSFRLLLYTYAFFSVSKITITKSTMKDSLKKIFANPIMVCMFLGLFIWLTQPIMPKVSINENDYSILRFDQTLAPLFYFVKLLDSLTTPLAMLLIGITLGGSDLKHAFCDKLAWLISLLKTCYCPLIVFLMCLLLKKLNIIELNEFSFITLVVGFSSPLSAVLNAYCVTYDNHQELASRICLLSTLEYIIVAPCFIVFIKMLYLNNLL